MRLAQHRLRRGQRGYSLVELLLTLSLLLLFTGLAVVSLDPLNQRSGVTEGAVRFETLLRYARAQAEHSGKRVRLNFIQDTNQFESAAQLVTNTVDAASLNHVELTWEPNPITEPDVFQNLMTIQWGVDQANELAAVSGSSWWTVTAPTRNPPPTTRANPSASLRRRMPCRECHPALLSTRTDPVTRPRSAWPTARERATTT